MYIVKLSSTQLHITPNHIKLMWFDFNQIVVIKTEYTHINTCNNLAGK